MQGLVGAILILAGSILISAGLVSTTLDGRYGFSLGGVIGVIGFAVLVAGPIKKGWDTFYEVGDDPGP